MRTIQASQAKTHLPELLDAVESGETLVITRHGRAIARIVPELDRRQAEIERAIAGIRAARKGRAKVSVRQILTARDEGRK